MGAPGPAVRADAASRGVRAARRRRRSVRDDGQRVERASAAAVRWGVVVVLKGARTVVAAPDGRVASSSFANPALGTGGTGDVLAGVIGSLLAQGVPTWEAACLGVHLHGVGGRALRERLGDAGLLASDLLAELPRVATRAPAPSVERRADASAFATLAEPDEPELARSRTTIRGAVAIGMARPSTGCRMPRSVFWACGRWPARPWSGVHRGRDGAPDASRACERWSGPAAASKIG